MIEIILISIRRWHSLDANSNSSCLATVSCRWMRIPAITHRSELGEEIISGKFGFIVMPFCKISAIL